MDVGHPIFTVWQADACMEPEGCSASEELRRGMSEGKTSLSKRGSPSDRDEMPRWMSEDMQGFSETVRDEQQADNETNGKLTLLVSTQ